MLRLIPFFTLFCLFCANSGGSINYIEHNFHYSLSGEVYLQSEVTFNKTENETKRYVVSVGSRGLTTYNSRIVSDGRTSIEYINGELEFIITKDEQANCEVRRSFSHETIYEKTVCNGHDMNTISISRDEILDKKCAIQDKILTCYTTFTGLEPETSHEYEIGSNKIYSYRAIPEENTQGFFMYSTSQIPNGQQIDTYELELPVGSPLPKPSDDGWRLVGKKVQTGYIPSIQKYTSSFQTNSRGSSKSMLEVF